MANKEVKKRPTQKHLVGKAREQAMTQVLTIGTGIILGLVIILVGWGIFREKVVDPGLTVAVIEGKEITGEEFQTRVRVNRQQTVNQYLQYYQNYLMFSSDVGFQQQFLNQMSLLQFQLDPVQMGLATINQLVDDELIILEAQKLGLDVSEEEIDREVEAIFAYYPDGTPTPEPSNTPFATSTLSAAQLAIVSVTPTPTQIPTSDAATAEPTAAPTEDTAVEPTEAVEETEAKPQPTATVYTQELFEADFAEYLDNQASTLGFDETALRQLIRVNLYRNKLFEYMTVDFDTTAEQVWARHILVEDEESAQALLDQLAEGADWAALAAEDSLDTSNATSGGNLGWFLFDQMVESFAAAAFELEIGEISEPVESSFGWHIIQVLGHENRPVDSATLDQEKNAFFSDYVDGLRSQYDWEIVENVWSGITPNEPEIPAQYKLTQ